MTPAAPQLAHAVPHVRAVEATRTSNGTIPCRDHDCFTLRGNDHVWSALRSRSLFNQHQFSALIVIAMLAEREDHLEREEELAVQVLVQAIEVAGSIA